MLSRGKIKKINSLKDKKTRQISQLFTIEGIKSVKEISLSAFITIEELYAVPEFHALASSIAPGRTEEINPEDMRRISSQTTPEGLLAVCRIPNHGHFAFKEGQLVIALDDIRDPRQSWHHSPSCRLVRRGGHTMLEVHRRPVQSKDRTIDNGFNSTCESALHGSGRNSRPVSAESVRSFS